MIWRAQARRTAQAGGGRYPEGPSPPTNRAAARFLERRTGLPPAALGAAAARGVGSTLRALTALQVLRAWARSRAAGHGPSRGPGHGPIRPQ